MLRCLRALQLIGTLSLMTSLASLIAVPSLTAASDTRLGRKNVLLLGLALDVVGELCLASSAVRGSRMLLLSLAPVRAISASVMPMCHAAAAQMEPANPAHTSAMSLASQKAANELAVGQRFGTISASINVALIFGPLLGSFLLQRFGPAAPFYCGAALTGAAWWIVLLLWVPEPAPTRVVSVGGPGTSRSSSQRVCDPFAGFRLFRKDARAHANSSTLRALGMCFLIEHLGATERIHAVPALPFACCAVLDLISDFAWLLLCRCCCFAQVWR
jgi:MFS family permease